MRGLPAGSPYGVFTILLDGTVISHYYLPEKKLAQLLDERHAKPL